MILEEQVKAQELRVIESNEIDDTYFVENNIFTKMFEDDSESKKEVKRYYELQQIAERESQKLNACTDNLNKYLFQF